MGSAYLAVYQDPALAVSEEDTQADLARAEIDRLTRQASIARLAEAIPRRLGGDATSEDLSMDKKRCRRVQHVLVQCWGDWTRRKTLAWLTSEDVRQEAARIEWPSWWAGHRVYLQQRTVYIATWGLRTDADARWTKSAVVRLQNELRFLEYALR